ncbi:MAG: site-2 protease family protein [Anaerolineales bacterium]|nr:site-2 protease family protein [Anaerolineales bacterium]MCW5854573.1 site-2 protease family protein [Anaerolineales bacterium]
MTLILFVVALVSLIVLHELGHFFAAKFSGIKVKEFGIGLPPRVMTLFKWGETDFTLNALPLGGFVLPEGENDPDVPGGLSAAPPLKRIFVLLAGPAMNLLAAVVLYFIIFMQIGAPDLSRVEVMSISPDSPAQTAGLQVGDVLLRVDGQPVTSSQRLQELIYASLGEQIELTIERAGEEHNLYLVPRDPPPPDGAIGIAMGNPSVAANPAQALSLGVQMVRQQADNLLRLPGRLLSGTANEDEGRLIGYKGMYDIFTAVRAADTAPQSPTPAGVNTMSFFASISISLGILNLLPLPALDGGRILFTLPELLFRRRVPAVYENTVNFVGFALLLMLLIYINVQDFLNPIVLP